jgi:hypothetical protein
MTRAIKQPLVIHTYETVKSEHVLTRADVNKAYWTTDVVYTQTRKFHD